MLRKMDNSLIKSNINAEIAKLQLKLTKIEQEERRSTPSILSERQIENKREYERRVSVHWDKWIAEIAGPKKSLIKNAISRKWTKKW